MNNKLVSPLTEDDLEGATYLCLVAAAMTDFDQFPPGSGNISRHRHHEHKHRFEKAKKFLKNGIASLTKLGLSYEDCAWAVSKFHLAKDEDGWKSRFQTAENELRKTH
jgi:hypothetical protein